MIETSYCDWTDLPPARDQTELCKNAIAQFLDQFHSHELSHSGLKPDEPKIEAVQQMP